MLKKVLSCVLSCVMLLSMTAMNTLEKKRNYDICELLGSSCDLSCAS